LQLVDTKFFNFQAVSKLSTYFVSSNCDFALEQFFEQMNFEQMTIPQTDNFKKEKFLHFLTPYLS